MSVKVDTSEHIYDDVIRLRCDERLKTKTTGSTLLEYTGLCEGTGTPEDKDEVNRREVVECDG
jgi:hypothetical protein